MIHVFLVSALGWRVVPFTGIRKHKGGPVWGDEYSFWTCWISGVYEEYKRKCRVDSRAYVSRAQKEVYEVKI